MIDRASIHAAIDAIPDEDLAALHQVIRQFARERTSPARRPGVFSRIKAIKIQGPEDLAANLDNYLSRSGSPDVPTGN